MGKQVTLHFRGAMENLPVQDDQMVDNINMFMPVSETKQIKFMYLELLRIQINGANMFYVISKRAKTYQYVYDVLYHTNRPTTSVVSHITIDVKTSTSIRINFIDPTFVF